MVVKLRLELSKEPDQVRLLDVLVAVGGKEAKDDYEKNMMFSFRIQENCHSLSHI